MEKLLIVEDDNDLREGLAFAFRSEKYEVVPADTVKKQKNVYSKWMSRESFWTATSRMGVDLNSVKSFGKNQKFQSLC